MQKDNAHKFKDGAEHNAHGDSSSSLASKKQAQAHSLLVADKRQEARVVHTNGSTPLKRQ